MVAQSPVKNQALNILTQASHLFATDLMPYPHDILLDNGAGIEIFSHVMTSGADQFDTAIVSLVVWLGTSKGGQKTMMNVDHTPEVIAAQIGWKDLHVAC